MRKYWTVPLRAGAPPPNLLARTSAIFLQLCSPKYGLHACTKADTDDSGETEELTGRSPVMLCGTHTVVRSDPEPEAKSELEGPFFAAAVTP